MFNVKASLGVGALLLALVAYWAMLDTHTHTHNDASL